MVDSSVTKTVIQTVNPDPHLMECVTYLITIGLGWLVGWLTRGRSRPPG